MKAWGTDDFLIIGHRGAAGLEPENTLKSFAAAYALGVGAVELDVHWKAPELLVIHDSSVDRTTNGKGALASHSLADLRRLDAGKGQPIPTLREVIAELPAGIALNIELKGPDTAAPTAALLAQRPGTEVLVSSFDHAELGRFRRLAAETPVAPLFGGGHFSKEAMVDVAIRLDAVAVNMSVQLASRELIQFISGRGFKVFVYTVNDLATAIRLKSHGANGVFTDLPDLVSAEAVKKASR